jgi:hypothetical protein
MQEQSRRNARFNEYSNENWLEHLILQVGHPQLHYYVRLLALDDFIQPAIRHCHLPPAFKTPKISTTIYSLCM